VYDPKLLKITFGGSGGGGGETKQYLINYTRPGETLRVKVQYGNVYRSDYYANKLPSPWNTNPPILPSELVATTQAEIDKQKKQTYTKVQVFWGNTLVFDDGVMDGKHAGEGDLNIYAGIGGGGGEGAVSNLTNRGEDGHYPGGGGAGGGVSSKYPTTYDTCGGKPRGTIITFYDLYDDRRGIQHQKATNYECQKGGYGDHGGASYNLGVVQTGEGKGQGGNGADGLVMLYYNKYPNLQGSFTGNGY